MKTLLSELGLTRKHRVFIAFLIFLWLCIVVMSAGGWDLLGVPWDFKKPGAFGDSFAPLSTLMATFAAVGAIATYRMQESEVRQNKKRQAEQDKITSSERARSISREFELDSRYNQQYCESTFFKFLKTFRGIVNSTDVGPL